MGIITGQGTSLQIGQETTWGTATPVTMAANYLQETLKLNVERKEEDTLVGGKTSRDMDIMKFGVDGDFSVLAKPQNIGLLIGLALGAETTAVQLTDDGTESGIPIDVWKHVFTMVETGIDSTLPSFTAVVNRHVAAKAYTGLKVESLKIEAKAGDYVRITMSVKGKAEQAGIIDRTLSIPDIKAFRFAGGSCTFDGVEFGDATGFTIEIKNTLDEGDQTLGSGYYGTENEPQGREVSISVETSYNAKTETVREQKYKTENNVDVKLKFVSPSEVIDDINYELGIDLPKVAVTECSPNVGGKEKITLTINGKALEGPDTEAVTVTLIDGLDTKYLK